MQLNCLASSVFKIAHKFDLRLIINEATNKWQPVVTRSMQWQNLMFLISVNGTCHTSQNRSQKTQRGLKSVALQSVKNRALYFFRGLLPAQFRLTLGGRNIPVVNEVSSSNRIIWRVLIEMMEAKALRTFGLSPPPSSKENNYELTLK